jgi:transcriptional regulator with XRE-family HTH domain
MTTWRHRLIAAIDADERSERTIALQSGFSHSYLHSLIQLGRTPSYDSLRALCDTLGVSMAYIAEGIKVTPEAEQLARTIAELSEDQRALVLAMIAQLKPPRPE